MHNFEYESISKALKNISCPAAVLDKCKFNSNVEKVANVVTDNNKSIRIGSKSLRVPQLINELQNKPRVSGILGFHPHEIGFYQKNFKLKDYLLAYPVFTEYEASLLAKGVEQDSSAKITAMVDCEEHLKLLESSAAKLDVTLYVCVDVNMTTIFLGQYAGTYRTPIKSAEEVLDLVKKIGDYPHLQFRGIMGYESQIASIPDKPFIYKWMKKHARRKVTPHRQRVVSTLEEEGYNCEIVNGGGSGSLLETIEEESITEVGMGSALFKPYIFDNMTSMDMFHPSLFMALRVVRKPTDRIATTFSGGYYCSQYGKAPIPVYPKDLKLINREQFGEVQTPFKTSSSNILNIGDLVLCRLAKAGEPLERFKEVVVIENGEINRKLLTYRGYNIWLG